MKGFYSTDGALLIAMLTPILARNQELYTPRQKRSKVHATLTVSPDLTDSEVAQGVIPKRSSAGG